MMQRFVEQSGYSILWS